MPLQELKSDLRKSSNLEKAKILKGFFKTGKGEYGEGDIFLGVSVPETRKIAKKHFNLEFEEIKQLLNSKIHEERLAALLLLVYNYEKHIEKRKEIFDFYLNNVKYINNWDLVDLSAPNIAGHFLYYFGNRYPAYKILLTNLANSSNLWERRIAIISTFYFIKNHRFDETLALAKLLLKDKHDLIHKAVGWMLREIGKRDIKVLETFLNKNYKNMPRIMLRYAIEKFPENKRKKYLNGRI